MLGLLREHMQSTGDALTLPADVRQQFDATYRELFEDQVPQKYKDLYQALEYKPRPNVLSWMNGSHAMPIPLLMEAASR